MPRYVIPFYEEYVFAGPAPASGAHYADSDGNLSYSPNLVNLVQPLPRIQELSYEINRTFNEYKSLGSDTVVARIDKAPATVNLNLSYLQYGVLNEKNLGFNVNYLQADGSSYYDNYSNFAFGGFVSRDFDTEGPAPYPLKYKDARNIFLSLGKEVGFDAHSSNSMILNDCKVLGFGNCYINSYNAKGSVGQVPSVSVNYTCENLKSYNGYTGQVVPSPNSTNLFSLPSGKENLTVSVLRPGDINLRISGYFFNINDSNALNFDNSAFNYQVEGNLAPPISLTGLHVLSYELTTEFRRRAQYGLQKRNTFDRPILQPIPTTFNVSILCNRIEADDLVNIFNYQQRSYDLFLEINNPVTAPVSGIAIKYDLLKATLNSVNSNSQIGAFAVVNLGFISETSSNTRNKGLYMSGLLNTPFQILEDNNRILTESGEPILTESGDYLVWQ